MLELSIVALLCFAAGSAYLLGRLFERDKRVAEKDAQITILKQSNQAYQNQLLTRQGSPPIFESDGTIRIEQVVSDSPLIGIMRPPFAQAELDWDDEEQEIQRSVAANPLVPALTDKQKAEILRVYDNLNGN